ncbi:MAG: Hpt domain-containing protein [Bacteroidota bacterium]
MNTSDPNDNLKQNYSNKLKRIDLSYLKDFANGDNAFIVEMIDAFASQTPEELNLISSALENKNWKTVRAVAHKMKPSITFMGISELKEVVVLILEYSSKEISLELIPELVNKFKTICNEAIKELEIEKKLYL